jgi:hypothetical protein
VRSTIEKEFGRWNFVTPELLSSPDDRQIWNQNYSGECPGIISGHFTGQEIGYAINLAKVAGKAWSSKTNGENIWLLGCLYGLAAVQASAGRGKLQFCLQLGLDKREKGTDGIAGGS